MVAVALPALSAEFAASASSVTLTVVTGYLVATLVSQVPAGSIADRIGYSRSLAVGRWLFLAGAIAGGLAPVLPVVVAGRLLMALGGSLIIPTAMALVRVAVPEPRRARAFGTMGAVMGGAAALGPAIGAWMSSHFGWRSLFVINVPLLIASWAIQKVRPTPGVGTQDLRVPTPGVVVAAHTTPGVRPKHAFDWIGSLLIGTALVLLTFATRAPAMYAWWLAAAGIVAAIALIWHERRVPAPVLHLSLFSERAFVAGSGVIATQNLAMYSLLLIVPFLFGGTEGADPQLGLAIIAMTATMAVTSPVGGWLVEWVGARTVVIAGGMAGAAGVLALMQLPASARALAVGSRLLLVGLGLGLSTGPAQAIALRSVDRARSGVASATMSMLRYLGAVAGTVVIGYALAPNAPAARMQLSLLVFAGAFMVSAVMGAIFPGSTRPSAEGRP
jgi:MFS family permease